ncbi:MAG: YfhO family protein [Proteobacteria bacterium]|nr:YfhO family protein [Pseudomonadota bacterium]
MSKGLFNRLQPLWSRHWAGAVKTSVYSILVFFLFSRVFFPGDKSQVFFGWDTLNSYWPDFAYRFRILWNGEFPLWNPYEHGGMPFASRSQAMLFYPPSWLLAVFALPDGRLSVWSMQYFIVFHFLVAALGAHSLARYLGAGKYASYFAGLTVVMCAPVLTHRNSNFLYPLVWMPWLLVAIDRLLEGPSRKTALSVAIMGIFAGSAASPPGVYNVVWTCALFALASIPWLIGETAHKHGRGKSLVHAGKLALWGAVAVTLVLFYLAIVYLPAIELLEHSSRSERGMSYVLDRALRFKHLPSLLNAHHPQTWWFDLFVGIPTLLTLGAALLIKPDRRVWILSVISVLCVWVAIADNGGLLLSAVEHVPGFSLNRKAYRYAAVFGILAGPLAARGISLVLDVAKSHGSLGPFTSPKRNRAYAALTFLIALILILCFAPDVPLKGGESAIWGARLVPWEALGVCILLGLPLLIPRLGKRFVLVPLVIIMVIQGSHLYWSASDRLKLNQSIKLAAEQKYIRRLPTTSVEWRLGIKGPRIGFGSRELMRYASGYKQLPMRLSRHLSFMKWANGRPSRLRLFNVRFLESKKNLGKSAKKIGHGIWELTNPVPLVAHYSAIERISNGRALKHWRTAEKKGMALIEKRDWADELNGFKGKHGERTTGKLVEYSANRIAATIEVKKPGLVVFNEVYFPGWRAFVDGKESSLYRCNYLLRGVVVDSGQHGIILTYRPINYGWMSILLMLSILGCGALALGRRWDGKHQH